MLELKLFTDGSVNTQQNIGCGAYLILTDLAAPINTLAPQIKVKQFEQTSSTKLELQIFLHGLEAAIVQAKGQLLTITAYTDSQNIVGLLARRKRLEQANYYSSKGKRLNNFELYQQFYSLADSTRLTLIKVEGHKKMLLKDGIDKIFSLVDKAARHALRKVQREM
ncbi:ribonuclease H [Saccharophagus degradans]|uniref:RNase H family protein n=1 Tax=Saccharophagus degradans TaxID=86304 RepID=UPI002477DC0B|nr:RNase H family protein [Saccharophagus degradans]WGO99120.1 ribonuclease H [Saccharophagus degradans]